MNISELLDRPIAYHRVFVTLTGSVKAAILLSQAIYWQKRARQADGWWYKTTEEWQDETGLTRHEQDSARQKCEKYLKTDLRDVPARLYWKVDEEELTNALFAENRQTVKPKIVKQDARNSSNINRYAEITTEITTKKMATNVADLPLDWQIAGNAEHITIQDDFDAQAKDMAGLIGTGLAGADELSYAFMTERHLLFTAMQVKGMRKAARYMLENKVKPEHVRRAVRDLSAAKMTVTDLYSVMKTAVDLANKKTVGYSTQRRMETL